MSASTVTAFPSLGEKVQEQTRGKSPASEAWRRLKKNPLALASLCYIIAVFAIGLAAPILPIQSFSAQNLDIARQFPSLAHPFGTDDFGRDMMSRVIWGAQTALLVATLPVVISMTLGILVGVVAGYYRGWVDVALMRVTEYFLAFPGMLLTIFLAATLKPQIVELVKRIEPMIGANGMSRTGIVDYMAILLILALLGWPGLARLIRGQVLSIRNRDYIEAARALGASERRILFVHVLPNLLGLLIVIVSMAMAGAIGGEATLSFLGIGIVPPYPSWGSMINSTYGYLRTPYWFLLVSPSFAVASLLFAFTYLGDGLSDAVNPQTR